MIEVLVQPHHCSREGIMTKKLVHKKSFIRSDIQYIRQELRRIEDAILRDDWIEAKLGFQEISAASGTHESTCLDNFHGIANAGYELAYTGLLS
jgi:hypothetical protein